MYNCDDVLTELGNYLDDEVAAEVRAQLEFHLAHCNTCTAIYDSARKTLKIVTDSSSFVLPENLSEPLVVNIMTKIREREDNGALEDSKSG